MKIGDRKIGEGPCYVIAEAGLNHNGNVDLALSMVRAAAKAGADAFKIQCYTAAEFCDPHQTYTYKWESPSVSEVPNGLPMGWHEGKQVFFSRYTEVTEKQIDLFRRCQLTIDDVRRIRDCCRQNKIGFIATATDAEWIDTLVSLGVDALKIGSDDLVYHDLIGAAARTNLPLILSTGMANETDIKAATSVILHNRRPALDVAFLHCVSLYPTPLTKAHLIRMVDLYEFLGKYAPDEWAYGYSDHTIGTAAASSAMLLGAQILEKHFTLDKTLRGPDHWFSANPEELTEICNAAPGALKILGTRGLGADPDEIQMREIARRSIVAKRDIKLGERIQMDMLTFKRPGTGLPPSEVRNILGMATVRGILAGAQISRADLEPLEILH